jgi:L-lactate dehydrogenase complex protein LldF
MRAVAWVFRGPRRFAIMRRLARLAQLPLVRDGRIRRLPGPLAGWTQSRDLDPLPQQSFRDWWQDR